MSTPLAAPQGRSEPSPTLVIEPPLPIRLPVQERTGAPLAFPVRRLYCLGRNYADHAREMGHDAEREPPFFFTNPAGRRWDLGKGFDHSAPCSAPRTAAAIGHAVLNDAPSTSRSTARCANPLTSPPRSGACPRSSFT